MKNLITEDRQIYVKRDSINSKREHTNIAKLDQKRIVSESYCGAIYQLKKGDTVIFDRTNWHDRSYYKTPCGIEFALDCGFNKFLAEKPKFSIELYLTRGRKDGDGNTWKTDRHIIIDHEGEDKCGEHFAKREANKVLKMLLKSKK